MSNKMRPSFSSRFERNFRVERGIFRKGCGEVLLDADGPDRPETFAGDSIDAGALAEEFFALAIDPYPRKPGAALPPAGEEEEGSAGPLHEKLKALTRKS